MARRAAVILTTPTGRPWTSYHFRHAWARARDRAGVVWHDETGDTTALHFHDLRGTAVTMLAEAGCTVPEIAAITGHSIASATDIIDRYMSRTRALAVSAIGKFVNAPSTKFANRLQTGAAGSAKGGFK